MANDNLSRIKPLRRQVHDQSRHRPRDRAARDRLGRGRQAGRPGAVAPRDVRRAKPELVIKGGIHRLRRQMGDPNASIPTPQPVWGRPMFGAHGGARAATCVTFVSADGLDAVAAADGIRRRVEAVRGTRALSKRDLPLNDALPAMEVDPDSYEVRADGEALACEPLAELPLAQRYFMF